MTIYVIKDREYQNHLAYIEAESKDLAEEYCKVYYNDCFIDDVKADTIITRELIDSIKERKEDREWQEWLNTLQYPMIGVFGAKRL